MEVDPHFKKDNENKVQDTCFKNTRIQETDTNYSELDSMYIRLLKITQMICLSFCVGLDMDP